MTCCSACGQLLPDDKGLLWDADKNLLGRGEQCFHLTLHEAALFDLLYRAQGRPRSASLLERRIWGLLDVDARNGLKVLICKLRKKLPDGMQINFSPSWYGEDGGYWLEIN